MRGSNVDASDRVNWLAAYTLGLAISGHDNDPVEELLRLAENDTELLDAAAARVHGLAVGDHAARRRAFQILSDAATSSRQAGM